MKIYTASKSTGGNPLGVRVSPPAPKNQGSYKRNCLFSYPDITEINTIR